MLIQRNSGGGLFNTHSDVQVNRILTERTKKYFEMQEASQELAMLARPRRVTQLCIWQMFG